ncbi:MAG: flagellar export protein FliJ [Burkholderiales bacterium]
MARHFPLKPLVGYAQNQTDDAARHLNELKKLWQAAEEKLRQLIAYRGEYRDRLSLAESRGLSVTAWRDYQIFMAKLDGAIDMQQGEVLTCLQRWEHGRELWMLQQRKLKAYQTLSKRHDQREMQRESKMEQREQDEFARHSFDRQQRKDEGDGGGGG